jgi:uncharacterized OB-fold protein
MIMNPAELSIDQIKALLGLEDEDLVKPKPTPSPWTKPYWDASREHRLVLRKCLKCGEVEHPPYLYCTNCHADEHEWINASGKATLVAYAINTYMVPFPFWADLPYVLAMVDLAEGPRMMTNIVECDHDALKNGMELEVVFDDDTFEDFTLPKFRPAK